MRREKRYKSFEPGLTLTIENVIRKRAPLSIIIERMERMKGVFPMCGKHLALSSHAYRSTGNPSMRLSDLFFAAGIVVWPLLLFSLVSIALIAERSFFWFGILQRQDSIIQEALKLCRSDWYSAIKLLQKNTNFPLSRIFLEAMELDRPNPMEFRLALESAAQAELPLLRRFNTVFDTIVAVSPLLGLLGTVLGLMNSFASLKLGDIGSSNTAGVTGGISEALASTVLGLVVAIFTLLFSNTFRGFYRRQMALIQEYGGRLELLHRKQYERERSAQS